MLKIKIDYLKGSLLRIKISNQCSGVPGMGIAMASRVPASLWCHPQLIQNPNLCLYQPKEQRLNQNVINSSFET